MSQFQYAVKMYLVSGNKCMFSFHFLLFFVCLVPASWKGSFKTYQIVKYYLLFTCFQDRNTQLICMGNSQMEGCLNEAAFRPQKIQKTFSPSKKT